MIGKIVLINIVLVAVVGVSVLVAGPLLYAPIVHIAETNRPAAGLFALLLWVLCATALQWAFVPGTLAMCARNSEDETSSMKDFATGWRKAGWRGFALAVLGAFGSGITIVNLYTYAKGGLFPKELAWVSAACAGLSFWGGAILAALLLHAWPLAVREKHPLRKTMLLSVYLAVKYPFYTVGALLLLLAGYGFSIFLLKTAPLWMAGIVATVVYMNSVHDVAVLAEEGKRPWDPEWRIAQAAEIKPAAELAAEQRASAAPQMPASWRKRPEFEPAATSETGGPYDRYHRTLRGLLKPWEQ